MSLHSKTVLTLGLVAIFGCGGGPSRVEAPQWDADDFADAILEKLDANGDAAIDQEELKGAPGLAAGVKRIDADGNQSLSRDELETRFNAYGDARLALTSKDLELTLNGRPINSGKVRLIPEFFLEGVVEPAEALILPGGVATPTLVGSTTAGLRPGYYRIVVESPNLKIPQKYVSAESTPLGAEVVAYSPDSRDLGAIRLDLQN